ncbi:MAG: AMP-binding protein, partial [Aeromicrobium sp.]
MTTTLGLDQSVQSAVFQNLRVFGDRPALLTADRVVTFADLADHVDRSAWATGQRRLVAIAGSTSIETLQAYVTALAHGHVVLMVPSDDPQAAASILEAYDPDVVLTDTDGLVVHRDRTTHDLHPDLTLLMSTSGSTGSPKLVRLSRENVVSNAESIAQFLQITMQDRALTTLPLQYCYGLSVVNSHLMTGASVVPTQLSVVDPCLWDLVDETAATSFAGVPYTFDLLDGIGFAEQHHRSLRQVTVAGGRLDAASVRRYAQLGRDHGWSLVPMYGQTEATARMAYVPPELVEDHPSALGVAIPGGALRLDPVPEASDLGSDVGELVYSGPNVMMGYAHTAADLSRGPEVGELRTGDLARIGEGGLYQWMGRRNRIAKLYGMRIDLDDVECALANLCVSGRCVSEGERLQVFVQRDRVCEAVRDAVVRHSRLPSHVVDVIDVDDQPRTSTGKVDYAALRHRAAAMNTEDHPDLGQTEPLSPTSVEPETVRALVAHLLGRPAATIDDSFQSLRGDSLSYVEVSVRLSELGLDLPPSWHRLPIRQLVDRAAPPSRSVRVDTSVVLRAVAIVLILGTHANLWTLPGGAHLLLIVVGFNLFRFRAVGESVGGRVRRALSGVARIAIPSMMWIGAVSLVAGTYTWSTVFMLNGLFGSDQWTIQWQFWFLEAIIWTQLGVLAVTCVPGVERMIRRAPFAVAMTAVAFTLAARFAETGVEAGATERYTPAFVLWCFALGWAAWAARSVVHRLMVSAALVLAVPGFFADPQREAVVIVGALL